MLSITNLEGNTNQTHKENCLTPVRNTIIKTTKGKFWQGSGEIGTFFMFNGYFHCELPFISSF